MSCCPLLCYSVIGGKVAHVISSCVWSCSPQLTSQCIVLPHIASIMSQRNCWHSNRCLGFSWVYCRSVPHHVVPSPREISDTFDPLLLSGCLAPLPTSCDSGCGLRFDWQRDCAHCNQKMSELWYYFWANLSEKGWQNAQQCGGLSDGFSRCSLSNHQGWLHHSISQVPLASFLSLRYNCTWLRVGLWKSILQSKHWAASYGVDRPLSRASLWCAFLLFGQHRDGEDRQAYKHCHWPWAH